MALKSTRDVRSFRESNEESQVESDGMYNLFLKAEGKATAEAKVRAAAKAKAKAEADDKTKAEAKAKEKAEEESQKGVAKICRSNNSAITDVRRWFGGVVMKIDPNGNCFGNAWMVAALVCAVQRSHKFAGLAAANETVREVGAFRELDESSATAGEEIPRTGHPAAYAGGEMEGRQMERERTCLSLKWGIASVARALDVWCAGDGWETQELIQLIV